MTIGVIGEETVQPARFGMYWTAMNANGLDYAIVELARSPEGIAPFPLRYVPVIRIGSTVTMIGHPHGGYKTIARDTIEYADDVMVQYAILCEPGSSGSPVIDVNGDVIAIHRGKG